MKRILKLLLAAIVVAALAGGGVYWWQQQQRLRSTDNAYVNADMVQVAAEVGGPVVAIHVREGQQVNADDALFDIDPAPFRVALEQAEARLALAEQNSRGDRDDIATAEAAVRQASVTLDNARTRAERLHRTRQLGFVSQQDDDNAAAAVREAEAALQQAEARLTSTRTRAGAAAILAARAAVDQARLDLQHTHVIASQRGWVTNSSLQLGTAVTPGAPLFAIVVADSFRVDANFKETELPGIQPGQAVRIHIDMLPGRTLAGVVDTIGMGTGAAFSLLPAQNATGNWVKVTQRIPVRIRLSGDAAKMAYRVGASAQVEVQIQS